MSPEDVDAPTAVLARRVSELRGRRGLTAKELGERLTDMGVKWDRFNVTALEKGKRQNLTLVEWLALARALDVAPIHLLIDPRDEPGSYQVTPTEAVPSEHARAWVRGLRPLGGTELRYFYREIPGFEWGCLWVLTKPKVDLDEDAKVSEMSRWVRIAYGGYGNPSVIGDDDESR